MNRDSIEGENNIFRTEITVSKIANADATLRLSPQLRVLSAEVEYIKTPLIKTDDDSIVCITQPANIIIKLQYR